MTLEHIVSLLPSHPWASALGVLLAVVAIAAVYLWPLPSNDA